MLLSLIPFITLIIFVIYSRNIILSITLANIASAIYISSSTSDNIIHGTILSLYRTYKDVLNKDSVLLILFIVLICLGLLIFPLK